MSKLNTGAVLVVQKVTSSRSGFALRLFMRYRASSLRIFACAFHFLGCVTHFFEVFSLIIDNSEHDFD